jgi:hypothetical protein
VLVEPGREPGVVVTANAGVVTLTMHIAAVAGKTAGVRNELAIL